MRHPRIKFEVGRSGLVHVYNRTVGSTGEYPFGDMEEAEFQRRIREMGEYYAIDVLATVVMGNHYHDHAILYIPADPVSEEETLKRFGQRYPGKRKPRSGSKRSRELALKLRDISAFMAALRQPFTRWLNRTRARRRRGHLWAERNPTALFRVICHTTAAIIPYAELARKGEVTEF
jgi:hypothetical protein